MEIYWTIVMNQISSNTKHIYPAGEKQPINHMCTCSRKQSSALNRLVPVASLDPAVSTRTRSELEQSYFNILAQKKRVRTLPKYVMLLPLFETDNGTATARTQSHRTAAILAEED